MSAERARDLAQQMLAFLQGAAPSDPASVVVTAVLSVGASLAQTAGLTGPDIHKILECFIVAEKLENFS